MMRHEKAKPLYNFWESVAIYDLFKTVLVNPGKSVGELSDIEKKNRAATSQRLTTLRAEKKCMLLKEAPGWKTSNISIDAQAFENTFQIPLQEAKEFIEKSRTFKELLNNCYEHNLKGDKKFIEKSKIDYNEWMKLLAKAFTEHKIKENKPNEKKPKK